MLAEVFNNIVEHAYAGHASRPVTVRVESRKCGVRALIIDQGTPMPKGVLPERRLPDTDVPRLALPEGGFGWHLIHAETNALAYHRNKDENHLELQFYPAPGS